MPRKIEKRQEMPEQEASQRILNFNEVPLGYTAEQAVLEAQRCLQCPTHPCIGGCPVNINIPAFIKLITQRDFSGALRKIQETNFLPAVCGRVCPQEEQCEEVCIVGKIDKPVAIGNLERFVADYAGKDIEVQKTTSSGMAAAVAIIGAGPAGISCSAELARRGYDVTIFEALHKPGGVLSYGIPEFRLPKDIVADEVKTISKLGVKIKLDTLVGSTYTFKELFEKGFKAVFIGVGAGAPIFLNVPGENAKGIYSANEFLTRFNLMKAYKFPEYDTPLPVYNDAVIIGGGNVAVDAARSALRLGVKRVRMLYRRTQSEMPARDEEKRHAMEEGIEIVELCSPKEFIQGDAGQLTGIICQKMKLETPDASGRPRPVPVNGATFKLTADMAIIAVGSRTNPFLLRQIEGLELNANGTVKVDETGQTSLKAVFAGGDITTGAATVIKAMGAGQSAAKAIDEYLKKEENGG